MAGEYFVKFPDALSRCPHARSCCPADVHQGAAAVLRRHAAGIPGPRASSPGELPSRLGGSPQRLPRRSPAPLADPRAPPPLQRKGCPRSVTPPMTPRKETSARSCTRGCAQPPSVVGLRPVQLRHRILRNWVARTCWTHYEVRLRFFNAPRQPDGSMARYPSGGWVVLLLRLF